MVIIESKRYMSKVEYNDFIGYWNEISHDFIPANNSSLERMIRDNNSKLNVYEVSTHKYFDAYYVLVHLSIGGRFYEQNNRTLIHHGKLSNNMRKFKYMIK